MPINDEVRDFGRALERRENPEIERGGGLRGPPEEHPGKGQGSGPGTWPPPHRPPPQGRSHGCL